MFTCPKCENAQISIFESICEACRYKEAVRRDRRRELLATASVDDSRVTVEGMIDSLRCWNLKYDCFPRTLLMCDTVLIECGERYTHEFVFDGNLNAQIAYDMLHEAMSQRADNFHGVCNY